MGPLSAQSARPSRATLVAIAGVALLGVGAYVTREFGHDQSHLPLLLGDYAGATFCHRITERSFAIAGRQMPLCARCSGMYLGFFSVALITFLAGRERWTALPGIKMMLVLLGLIGVMGIDGVNSTTHFFEDFPHLYTPHNNLRLFTGLGTGLTMGVFLIPAFGQVVWRPELTRERPLLTSWRELLALMTLLALTGLLLLSNLAAVSYVLALASVAGLLMILTAVVTILLLVALRRDGQAANWKTALPSLFGGLAIALLLTGLGSYARLALLGTLTGFPGLG